MILPASVAWACLFPASQAPPEAYSFLWRPRPRQVVRYRLSIHIELPGTTVSMLSDLVETVGKPDKSGAYNVSTATRNMRVLTGADTQVMPDEAPVIERYDAKGRRVSRTEEPSDPFSSELFRCTDFVPPPAPVKVGQRWSAAVKAAQGFEGGRTDYRLVDTTMRAKVRLLHVRFAFVETGPVSPLRSPVSAEGFLYIDPHDFSIVESEATVHNGRVSPDVPPSPYIEVRMVRIASR